MTGQDIVNACRAEVIEPNPAFFTQTTLLLWINNAQKNYVRRTRCLQNFATTSTVQGQADYPMPVDWLASEKVFWNDISLTGISNWRPLTPTSVEKMAQESPNFLSTDSSMQGKPQKYYIVNQTLFIYPKPQVSGSNDIFMFYESKPITLLALTDSLSLDDSLSDGIEAYVLWKLWKMDQEKDLSDEQLQRFKDEIGQGLKWKKQRVLDGKWKIDIESFMPFNYSSVNGSAFNNQINPLNI